jgi:Zn-finger nucleic acid-binding protein
VAQAGRRGGWRGGGVFCYYIKRSRNSPRRRNASPFRGACAPRHNRRRRSKVADIFDERRRGLEEEYFRRKDKESLAKLREALREEAHSREEAHTMDCPRCTGKLHEEIYDDMSIDRCDTCGGIWLDAGELEQIISQENAVGRWSKVLWPGRMNE